MEKQYKFWACDFETTVWGEEVEKKKGKQTSTEVWAAADVALYDTNEKVTISHSIREFMGRFLKMNGNNILYFHNLSFDGSFIVDWLLREGYTHVIVKDKDMRHKQFRTSISRMGQWYFIKICFGKKVLEIRDSLKLMPASLRSIGKSFDTKHKKLEMEYSGKLHAYCNITSEEQRYIENDVLVLKEALEKMFDEGHDKLTIGSCCLAEFKEGYEKTDYNVLFPDITKDPIDENTSGSWNFWEYVHKSYCGGWCYVNPLFAHQIIGEGVVYDVNSLYPSMMSSKSGNYYPYGMGEYHIGAPPEKLFKQQNKFLFMRVRCRFRLKENALPWLHIRGSNYYKPNENLVTSDVRVNGKYYRYYVDENNKVHDTKVELTLTGVDWLLLLDTYELYDLEYLDFVEFWAQIGLFDNYINHYAQMKQTSKGFKRQLAKLFLNNLYGKFAMSDDSTYKVPYMGDDGIVKFETIESHEKKVGYIPIGSAITSYARNFTIRHALANRERFLYADTDSIHLIGTEDAKMVIEHPTEFCHWKQEGKFSSAYYERQKMYVEVMIEENHVLLDDPRTEIKAAGMSASAKESFLEKGYTLDMLSVGLELEDVNLKATRIKGGILLKNKTFKIREAKDKKVTAYQYC